MGEYDDVLNYFGYDYESARLDAEADAWLPKTTIKEGEYPRYEVQCIQCGSNDVMVRDWILANDVRALVADDHKAEAGRYFAIAIEPDVLTKLPDIKEAEDTCCIECGEKVHLHFVEREE